MALVSADGGNERPSLTPWQVSGHAVSIDGKPVGSAVVSILPVDPNIFETRPAAQCTTDALGNFSFKDIPPATGYSITVTAQGYLPGYVLLTDSAPTAKRQNITVAMTQGPSRLLHGRVLKPSGQPAGNATVLAFAGNRREREILAVTTDSSGTFTLAASVDKYLLMADAKPYTPAVARVPQGFDDAQSTLKLGAPAAPAPPTAASEIRSIATRVATTGLIGAEPLAEALVKRLCGARIIGIGEATHGASEFLRLKGNVLLGLARSCSFNVLLLEVDTSAAEELDRYVRTGQGNPGRALVRTGNWIYMHKGMLELLDAIRTFNQTAPSPIHIIGIDPFFSDRLTANLLAYVKMRDVPLHKALGPDLLEMQENDSWQKYPMSSPEVRARVRGGLRRLHDFVVSREGKDETPEEWLSAMLRLQALETVERRFSAPPGERGVQRDLDMAALARSAVEVFVPRGKAVLSAHNGHVMLARPFWKISTLGDWLSDAYSSQYVSIGGFFGKGSFVAMDRTGPEAAKSLRVFEAGERLVDGFETVLFATGLKNFIFDPSAKSLSIATRQWLRSELLYRELGSTYFSATALRQHVAPSMAFHMVAYIDEISPLDRSVF